MEDIFRKEYRVLNDDEKAYIGLFKEKAQELFNEFNNSEFLKPDQRKMSLAKTNLEQSIMWAVKSITG